MISVCKGCRGTGFNKIGGESRYFICPDCLSHGVLEYCDGCGELIEECYCESEGDEDEKEITGGQNK